MVTESLHAPVVDARLVEIATAAMGRLLAAFEACIDDEGERASWQLEPPSTAMSRSADDSFDVAVTFRRVAPSGEAREKTFGVTYNLNGRLIDVTIRPEVPIAAN